MSCYTRSLFERIEFVELDDENHRTSHFYIFTRVIFVWLLHNHHYRLFISGITSFLFVRVQRSIANNFSTMETFFLVSNRSKSASYRSSKAIREDVMRPKRPLSPHVRTHARTHARTLPDHLCRCKYIRIYRHRNFGVGMIIVLHVHVPR